MEIKNHKTQFQDIFRLTALFNMIFILFDLPGISDHALRSTSRPYVAESFASLQIDKWRDIGDDRSKFTNQPVIV